MIFRQVLQEDLGCASYLVGDERAGVAAVVDPQLEVEHYLRLARQLGVRITDVVETHTHADHVSGHGRLAVATGARIHAHELAGAEYEHVPFGDDLELELGSVVLHALHTPGHRPEHTALLVTDRRRADEPWAVLTGDALFVGDTGRPDLAVEAEQGARDLYRALHERLLALPDHVEVWPGHLGGSLCGGAAMDRKASSTIGFERRFNPALATADEDEFVRRSLAAIGARPPRFERIVAANRGPLRVRAPEPEPLAPRQVQLRAERGELVVDVRTAQQFDEAHVPGSVSVPALRPGFGSKLAWLAAPDQPVVLVGRDGAEARAAARLAASVGVDDVPGYLAGGMTGWREEGRPVRRTPRADLEQLRAAEQAGPLTVLDVRDPDEWRAGRIAGARNVPYHRLVAAPDGVDLDAPIAVVCASGARAGVGASLLERLGARDVTHVVEGDLDRWAALGGSVERG